MMGAGPIPLSEIFAYLDGFGIFDAGDREEFIFLIQQMDDEFMQHQARRAKSKQR